MMFSFVSDLATREPLVMDAADGVQDVREDLCFDSTTLHN
jgi:hypothetical protein